jgi:hypothetical protein
VEQTHGTDHRGKSENCRRHRNSPRCSMSCRTPSGPADAKPTISSALKPHKPSTTGAGEMRAIFSIGCDRIRSPIGALRTSNACASHTACDAFRRPEAARTTKSPTRRTSLRHVCQILRCLDDGARSQREVFAAAFNRDAPKPRIARPLFEPEFDLAQKLKSCHGLYCSMVHLCGSPPPWSSSV